MILPDLFAFSVLIFVFVPYALLSAIFGSIPIIGDLMNLILGPIVQFLGTISGWFDDGSLPPNV